MARRFTKMAKLSNKDIKMMGIEVKQKIADELQGLRQAVEDMRDLTYNVLSDNDVIDDSYLPDYMKMPDLSFMNVNVNVNKGRTSNGQRQAKGRR